MCATVINIDVTMKCLTCPECRYISKPLPRYQIL